MKSIQFEDHYSYVGGSFKLTPGKLEKAIKIAEEELKKYEQRLFQWENNPEHESFAHDMKWHGPETIDMLVRNHVQYSRMRVRALKDLRLSQLRLNL